MVAWSRILGVITNYQPGDRVKTIRNLIGYRSNDKGAEWIPKDTICRVTSLHRTLFGHINYKLRSEEKQVDTVTAEAEDTFRPYWNGVELMMELS
jgi:hypothetical protein